MNRRDMLKLTGAGIAAAILPKMALAKADKQAKIALQLYSVRNDAKKDFDKALEEVAKMGYSAVEFAGYFKYSSKGKELRKRLDDLGLKAAGTHIRAGSFEPENIQRTIDFHLAIGCKYLIVPGDGRFTKSDASNKAYAEFMTKTAATLKPHGLCCGHHNHTKEFKKIQGKTYWDLFAERTSKDVVLQQDIGWSTYAGQVPADLIRRYPGRHKIVHCKPTVLKGDKDKKPFIGQDSVKWEPALIALREVGGCEWLTVESERIPKGMNQMQCAKLSLDGLKRVMASL